MLPDPQASLCAQPQGDDPINTFLLHPVSTFRISGDGQILAANLAAETLCTLPRNSMEGRDVKHIIRLADAQLWRVLDDPEKTISAYGVTLSAGRSAATQADIRLSDALSIGESVVRILAISPISPIADRMQLQSGSRGKSAAAAAAMLAHEIKNPLSGIKGAAQLLERTVSEDAARFTRLICSEVDRIAALIDRMQDLSRESVREKTAQNLYPALFQARDIAVAGFARPILVEEDYDPSLPDVLIDHDAMVQILLNLLKNASEALADTPHPRIRISTAFRHGLSYAATQGSVPVPLPIEVRISDTGPGVPAALVDDMFNPFVTGKRIDVAHSAQNVPYAPSDPSSGHGLGLALVDKLVRDLGGLVRYRRDGMPLMTHFEIHLPIEKG